MLIQILIGFWFWLLGHSDEKLPVTRSTVADTLLKSSALKDEIVWNMLWCSLGKLKYKSFRFVKPSLTFDICTTKTPPWHWWSTNILQGECSVTHIWSGFWPPYLWSPAESKVLQWNRELPEGWNPLQVMNMHGDMMTYWTNLYQGKHRHRV